MGCDSSDCIRKTQKNRTAMVIYPESSLLEHAAKRVWSGSDTRIKIDIAAGKKLTNALSPYFDERLESVFITDSDIRHIKKKHVQAERSRGQVPIEPADFAKIPIVLNEFDFCEYTDTDKLGNKKFLIQKTMEDEVYLVTVQRGKRMLEIKTMWKKNRSGASC